MASVSKYRNGYRAHIQLKGIRESKTFSTKREAVEWVAKREAEIHELAELKPSQKHTLRDALRRYSVEVSTTKRGARWEQIRLAAFEELALPIDTKISEIQPSHIALYRDSRLKSVSSGTVLRELGLLSSVFEMCRLEWGWVINNPCKDIRKPPSPKHRERVLTVFEIKKMLRVLGYQKGARPISVSNSVAICMLVALRTGMRAGELCGLTWENVKEDFVILPVTKNGSTRHVPLSSKAKNYIKCLDGWDSSLVFGLKTQTLDAMFRKYKDKAGLSGFTWHDTRHTAATMLSKKLDVLDLCKMFGWRDPKMAMIYYNPNASVIAKLLN